MAGDAAHPRLSEQAVKKRDVPPTPASDARLKAMARQLLRANGDRNDGTIAGAAIELAWAVGDGCSREDQERFRRAVEDLCGERLERD